MKQTPLVYLYGYPGVGKNTIAREMELSSDLIAIQNHLLSNAFRHVTSRVPREKYKAMELRLRHHTMKTWLNFLEFVSEVVPDQGLVMTSVMYQNDPDRVEFFNFMRRWAAEQNRLFVPVCLTCTPNELLRRVTSPGRTAEFKLTDSQQMVDVMENFQLLKADDALVLDVTNMTQQQAAAVLLEHLANKLAL